MGPPRVRRRCRPLSPRRRSPARAEGRSWSRGLWCCSRKLGLLARSNSFPFRYEKGVVAPVDVQRPSEVLACSGLTLVSGERISASRRGVPRHAPEAFCLQLARATAVIPETASRCPERRPRADVGPGAGYVFPLENTTSRRQFERVLLSEPFGDLSGSLLALPGRIRRACPEDDPRPRGPHGAGTSQHQRRRSSRPNCFSGNWPAVPTLRGECAAEQRSWSGGSGHISVSPKKPSSRRGKRRTVCRPGCPSSCL